MYGFKAFDKNLKCKDMQFKVGKSYTIKGDLVICSNGFHFCKVIDNVYNYYSDRENTRICFVKGTGKSLEEGDKVCFETIEIIHELDKSELATTLTKNNSGNRNSGYGNSGNRNSGDGNSGDGNSGDGNSGYGNSGDWNSGYGNSGNRNSGYGNSGNRNSGDWNSGDGNSGYFSTAVPLYFFNKPSNFVYTQEFSNKIRSLNVKPILTWIYEASMTEEEKTNNPSHKTTGGFLRKTNRQDFSQLSDKDKEFIKSLPNFDDVIFKEITGVSLCKPKVIAVTHEGKTFEIDIEKAKELGIIK